MRKLKITSIALFLALAITSFVMKYDALIKEGPRQELVLSIENESVELNLYRETFISGIKLKGYAFGPNLLQKSGSFDEVISIVLNGKPVELNFEDKRGYRLELKSTVPVDDIREEVALEIIKELSLTAETVTIDKKINYLKLEDKSLAQSGIKDIPVGAASYSDTRNRKRRYLGYSLEMLAESLNEDFENWTFVGDAQNEEYLGIEVILNGNLETVLKELKNQGIKSEEKVIQQEVLLISKN
ncbi:hypothetical protein SAMN06295967_10534 [Belliella buryatensis]|uniref:Uncharacterized protein n=1 Tax=Belliella buryatensis TaxID=1500549 RepID=A0A239CHA9_9BACT|nr:hypothetical protein [Belliella buryatensis]SNS19262.1 hypothetical protein SAMN06295967_10534 [Belliella buryatensis]